jgi:hypothetical protein
MVSRRLAISCAFAACKMLGTDTSGGDSRETDLPFTGSCLSLRRRDPQGAQAATELRSRYGM